MKRSLDIIYVETYERSRKAFLPTFLCLVAVCGQSSCHLPPVYPLKRRGNPLSALPKNATSELA